jgi:hypothetical protein
VCDICAVDKAKTLCRNGAPSQTTSSLITICINIATDVFFVKYEPNVPVRVDELRAFKSLCVNVCVCVYVCVCVFTVCSVCLQCAVCSALMEVLILLLHHTATGSVPYLKYILCNKHGKLIV